MDIVIGLYALDSSSDIITKKEIKIKDADKTLHSYEEWYKAKLHLHLLKRSNPHPTPWEKIVYFFWNWRIQKLKTQCFESCMESLARALTNEVHTSKNEKEEWVPLTSEAMWDFINLFREHEEYYWVRSPS